MTLRRVVTTLVVVTAGLAFVWAFTLRGEEDDVALTHAAVERLVPPDGAQEVRQTQVGVDLQPGWTGVLLVAGVEIPEDQLRRVEAQNQFFFQPGDGKEFESFPPGRLCAAALIWPVDSDRESADRVGWCFRVA